MFAAGSTLFTLMLPMPSVLWSFVMPHYVMKYDYGYHRSSYTYNLHPELVHGDKLPTKCASFQSKRPLPLAAIAISLGFVTVPHYTCLATLIMTCVMTTHELRFDQAERGHSGFATPLRC